MLAPNQTSSASRSKGTIIHRLESILRQYLPNSYRQKIKQLLVSQFFSLRQPTQKQAASKTSLENIRQQQHLTFLRQVKQEVESILLPSVESQFAPEAAMAASLLDQHLWTEKQRDLHQVLTDLHPATVLDIGCGTGWYSKFAAHLGSQVIAFDLDEACITQLYFDTLESKLPILPLVMDFTKPTPARGLANNSAIAATERLQCDLVLTLGLVHQIVLNHRLNFDQIAEGLALFSKQWAVAEFIPQQDPELATTRLAEISWYTLETFMEALGKWFKSVKILSSYPDGRSLLLCEK